MRLFQSEIVLSLNRVDVYNAWVPFLAEAALNELRNLPNLSNLEPDELPEVLINYEAPTRQPGEHLKGILTKTMPHEIPAIAPKSIKIHPDEVIEKARQMAESVGEPYLRDLQQSRQLTETQVIMSVVDSAAQWAIARALTISFTVGKESEDDGTIVKKVIDLGIGKWRSQYRALGM